VRGGSAQQETETLTTEEQDHPLKTIRKRPPSPPAKVLARRRRKNVQALEQKDQTRENLVLLLEIRGINERLGKIELV